MSRRPRDARGRFRSPGYSVGKIGAGKSVMIPGPVTAAFLEDAARPPEEEPLPVEERADGISVRRIAFIVWNRELRRFRFSPTGDGASTGDYGRCSSMKCSQGHTKPEPGCVCGFYAFRSRVLAQEGAGTYATQALLSGRILEHGDGYRAEHLDVMEIELPELCVGSQDPGASCGEVAVTLALRRGYSVRGDASTVWALVPTCRKHLEPDALTVTAEELERSLGVPVIAGLPGQYRERPTSSSGPVAVTVAANRDDLAAAPGHGPLADLLRGWGYQPPLFVCDLLVAGAAYQWPIDCRDPSVVLYLQVTQCEGYLRARFIWCGNPTREFIIPL